MSEVQLKFYFRSIANKIGVIFEISLHLEHLSSAEKLFPLMNIKSVEDEKECRVVRFLLKRNSRSMTSKQTKISINSIEAKCVSSPVVICYPLEYPKVLFK